MQSLWGLGAVGFGQELWSQVFDPKCLYFLLLVGGKALVLLEECGPGGPG